MNDYDDLLSKLKSENDALKLKLKDLELANKIKNKSENESKDIIKSLTNEIEHQKSEINRILSENDVQLNEEREKVKELMKEKEELKVKIIKVEFQKSISTINLLQNKIKESEAIKNNVIMIRKLI